MYGNKPLSDLRITQDFQAAEYIGDRYVYLYSHPKWGSKTQPVRETEIFSFSLSTLAVPRMSEHLFVRHWGAGESMDKHQQTQK